jgi:hypothetical protein
LGGEYVIAVEVVEWDEEGGKRADVEDESHDRMRGE